MGPQDPVKLMHHDALALLRCGVHMVMYTSTRTSNCIASAVAVTGTTKRRVCPSLRKNHQTLLKPELLTMHIKNRPLVNHFLSSPVALSS